MQYAEYEFYANVYFGNEIAPEDFQRLSARASEYVYGMTRGLCEKVPEGNMEAVQKAVCAVAEILQDEGRMASRSFSAGKTISSETVGSHSVSYGSPSISGADLEYLENRKREVLALYLSGVPILADLFKARSFSCTHRTR